MKTIKHPFKEKEIKIQEEGNYLILYGYKEEPVLIPKYFENGLNIMLDPDVFMVALFSLDKNDDLLKDLFLTYILTLSVVAKERVLLKRKLRKLGISARLVENNSEDYRALKELLKLAESKN